MRGPSPAARHPQPPARTGHSGAADVALAEFSALRGEIDNLANAQRMMLSLNVTVVATIAGLVLSEKASPHLVLVIPLVSSAIGLVYQWYVLHAKHIGDYVNDTLRPLLVEHTGDERVLGWEKRLRTEVYARRGSRLAGQLAYILLFPTIPAVSLVAAVPHLDSGWHQATWVAGAVLSAGQVTIWAWQTRSWVCWT